MDLGQAHRAYGHPRRSRVNDRDYFPLGGGLNLAQTPLQLKPGELVDCLNYECRTLGGYQRFQGFERLDGRTAPSATNYYLVNFNTGTPANYPVVGATVNGQTSGATGTVIYANFIDGTGLAGYVVLLNVTGNFVNGENLRVGASVFGHAVGTQQANAASDSTLGSAYRVAAREAQRALIQAVPGSGPVRGVVEYRGNVYAFRNNVGGSACVMYKATATGWTAVPGFAKLKFTGGLAAGIAVGNTVTGATSAHTGVVRRIVITSGTFAGNNAAGYLILSGATGSFTNGENLQVAASTRAVASGTAVVPTLAPGGTFIFRVWNFYGATGTLRLYGVDGQNNAFEYQDGASEFFCQIETGMATDKPTHIAAHRGRLWLAFPGGSVQVSSANDPAVWSPVLGAAELAVGDEVTAFLEEMSPSLYVGYSSATLFIFCANRTFTITGDGPNWVLAPFAIDTGAKALTVQRLGQGVLLDDRGFTLLSATQKLGNFDTVSFSQKLGLSMTQDIIAKAICSSISRNRSLYRLFLNDGRFVSIAFNDAKPVGITIGNLGKVVQCAYAGETSSGAEFLLAGATDGYVYQIDSGVQMDGQPIIAQFVTANHFSGTPSRQKRYRRGQFDLLAEGKCSFRFQTVLNYGDPAIQGDTPRSYSTVGSTGGWDTMVWDEFLWDAQGAPLPAFKLETSGLSMAHVIYHSSTDEPPHTFQGIALHHSQRRLDRSSVG